MFKNLKNKGKYIEHDVKEHIGSAENELKELVTTGKNQDDRNEVLKQAIDENVQIIDSVTEELIKELFESAKDMSVPIPPTRQDVIDALRILRSAGGALYKSSSVPYGMEEYTEGGFYPGKTDEESGGIREYEPQTYDGGKIPGPSSITFEDDYSGDTDLIVPKEYVDKDMQKQIDKNIKKYIDENPEKNIGEGLQKYIKRKTEKYVHENPKKYTDEDLRKHIAENIENYTDEYLRKNTDKNPQKYIRKNPLPPDIIMEDDARYAMDIVKIGLPNSTAIQENVDLMPNFNGDNVSYGDKVFVTDDEVIYVEDPEELSGVKRKPCKQNTNWFLYFLLGVLMTEDETIDLAWVLSTFILCPIQTAWNINFVAKIKLIVVLIPFVGPLIANAIPYFYFVEEFMYKIAKAKADQICGRRLILTKKYSCFDFGGLLSSEKYFMKGKENDWIANQIVSEIISPEVERLQASESYERLLNDNRQIAISLSAFVYDCPALFANIEFPDEDLVDTALEYITQYMQIDYDMLMILGSNTLNQMASIYEGKDDFVYMGDDTEHANEYNPIFDTISTRLINVFRMKNYKIYAGLTPLKRMQKVITSIMNFRMMESRYYIYFDEIFPEKRIVDGKEEGGYYEDPET